MKIFRNVLAVIASAALLVGCGGGGGNDNGGSVTAIGTFKKAPDDLNGTDLPAGDAGQVVALNSTPLVTTYVGVVNNMTSQTWRGQRVELSFDIPGAQQNPPDNIDGFNPVLGPVVAEGATAAVIPTRNFVQIFAIPQSTMQWIVSNQSLLPPLPFTVYVSIRAVGVTQAGNSLRTNVLGYPVYFVDEATLGDISSSSSTSSSN